MKSRSGVAKPELRMKRSALHCVRAYQSGARALRRTACHGTHARGRYSRVFGKIVCPGFHHAPTRRLYSELNNASGRCAGVIGVGMCRTRQPRASSAFASWCEPTRNDDVKLE